jgi:hypothetical protein
MWQSGLAKRGCYNGSTHRLSALKGNAARILQWVKNLQQATKITSRW